MLSVNAYTNHLIFGYSKHLNAFVQETTQFATVFGCIVDIPKSMIVEIESVIQMGRVGMGTVPCKLPTCIVVALLIIVVFEGIKNFGRFESVVMNNVAMKKQLTIQGAAGSYFRAIQIDCIFAVSGKSFSICRVWYSRKARRMEYVLFQNQL